MLKQELSEHDLVTTAETALKSLLQDVPALSLGEIVRQPMWAAGRPDLTIDVNAFGTRQTLIIEVKKNAQPRFARGAILELREYVRNFAGHAIPILISPYISPEVQTLCKEQDVSYLDLEGNARILFENMFIEHKVPTRPASDKRHLKSLFRPKSAQILRVMMRSPHTPWKVKDLADAADVSLGQVSNVRTALLEREWATETPEGVILMAPDAVLDTWRDEYTAPAGQRATFYTTKHGKELEAFHLDTVGDAQRQHIARAGFSAAAWIAPYARVPFYHFYVDFIGYDILRDRLNLAHVDRGENVVVTLLKDMGPLRDTVEIAPGVVCTSPVQTYLDLWHLGERGREAADHLREERLKWSA